MKILHSLFRASLWLLLFGICGAALLFTSSILYLSPNLPTVEKLREVQLQTPLKIYTSDHKLISEFGEKRRTPLTFDEVPPLFVKAILAAEDDRFYQHHGVDITGLMRAALELVTTGSIRTGGSTITMQVAKNFFLSAERTFIRKFNEILLALQIERELSKNEILELYVNKIYLGHRSYGIAAAAQVYYGKNISDLNVSQLAMIAGLPKAPSRYNPITNPARALVRRNWILQRMNHLGYIDQTTLQQATSERVTAEYHGLTPEVNASYLAEMVRKEMLDRYGKEVYTDGYTVVTTVSADLQQYANVAVQSGLQNYDRRHGYRGPEAHIELQITANQHQQKTAKDTESGADSANLAASSVSADPMQIDQWRSALKDYQSYGPLIPGLVISTSNKSAKVFLKTDEEIILTLDAVSWARPYISVNQRGPKPKLISDVLTVGDIIRVHPANPALEENGTSEEDKNSIKDLKDQWSLGQLPDAQAALVVLSPKNGAIRAIVGGFDFNHSKFNRVIQAGRQPGSNFKPFVYTAALANGFTAASIINDAPVVFDDKNLESSWRPENYSGKFFGPTRIRQALYKSRNLVSIRLLRATGISNAIEYAERFGFDSSKLPKDLSLALGSAALTPLEVATGYTVFANGGYHVEPYFIQSVSRDNGETVYEAEPLTVCEECEDPPTLTSNASETQADQAAEISDSIEPTDIADIVDNTPIDPSTLSPEERFLFETGLLNENKEQTSDKPKYAPRVVDARIIYIANSMLQDVIKRGTGRKARVLGRSDLGGKTGTTNDQKDAWFSGFNPDLVATAWLGFDTPKTLGAREFGGTAALPIWIDFMEKALANYPQRRPKQPPGLVTIKIDPVTGERAAPGQENAIFEIFREELAPKKLTANNNKTGTPREEKSTIEDIF